MLGSKDKSKTGNFLPTSGKDNAGDNSTTCVIAKGTFIEGKFTTSENVRIDGTIKGEVKCEKRIVMGDTGKIEGDVQALHSTIKGTIEGTVQIFDTLHLMDTAFIKGKIATKTLVVDEGARYEGELMVGDKQGKK